VQGHGASFDVSIVAALLVTVPLATAVTYLVEQPAMRWIRSRYRQRVAQLA
jgi:peptidoglycan/LPS O-acetylase OafA/YrhL